MEQGRNGFGSLGYAGACPPSGTHTYRFVTYALDTTLALRSGASREELLRAMRGHILATSTIVGETNHAGLSLPAR
jgi:Raf kinase inhibitor-like YbhB/YbcL family protein